MRNYKFTIGYSYFMCFMGVYEFYKYESFMGFIMIVLGGLIFYSARTFKQEEECLKQTDDDYESYFY